MKRKIFIIFIIILLISTLMTAMLSLNLVKNNHTKELEQRLLSNALLIEQSIQEKEKNLAEEELKNIIDNYGKKINTRITLLDELGDVIVDTSVDKKNAQNHRSRPEIQEALKGNIGKKLRYSNTLKRDMLYVALPVDLKDQGIRVIRMAISFNELQKINRNYMYYISFTAFFSLFAALLIGYRFINKITEPIKQVTDAAKQISNGQFNKRVKVTADDEIGELASHFNHMANHLQETIEQLTDSNTKFKALLISIINPIIAVDNRQHIILFNPAAEQLLKVEAQNAIGRPIQEVIRNYSLDKQLEEIFDNPSERQMEIRIKGPEAKSLKVYINPIYLENDPMRTIGIVTLIEDVTEIRKLEKIRSDFVTNVSHELKTPLTSISGFVETLKSGTIDDEDTKMRFLDIIDIEAERLKRLINDILTLSEIENMESKGIKNIIDTTSALKEVEEIMDPIATDKKIQLLAEIHGELPCLYGNSDWFKQMMINLLDNAIKYTPQGGKVYLSAYKKYNNIVIHTKDTGIGIPKKDLPRLFERFYRVDKARSRKVGGTGLGLAIVKHIVLSFNGRIKVNSKVGKGTEFTVILPVQESNGKGKIKQ